MTKWSEQVWVVPWLTVFSPSVSKVQSCTLRGLCVVCSRFSCLSAVISFSRCVFLIQYLMYNFVFCFNYIIHSQ